MRFVLYDTSDNYNIVLFDESLTENVTNYIRRFDLMDTGSIGVSGNKLIPLDHTSDDPEMNILLDRRFNSTGLKYISYDDPRKFILFSLWEPHSQTVINFKIQNLKSAGFFKNHNLSCYGESVSLFISSRPEDSDLLLKSVI
jgi:hypothetical protein